MLDILLQCLFKMPTDRGKRVVRLVPNMESQSDGDVQAKAMPKIPKAKVTY